MPRKDREVTDINEIKAILHDSHVIHSGFRTEDYPYVVPTNFGYEFDDANHLTLYMHGAPVGHKRDLIKQDGRMGFEIDDGGQLMNARRSQGKHPELCLSKRDGVWGCRIG